MNKKAKLHSLSISCLKRGGVYVERLNCWEIKKCGREVGGDKAVELGICPASLNTQLDGVHSGISAGRACWAVAGTMCSGQIQGSFAQKYKDCGLCDFYNRVKEEEGEHFVLTIDLLGMIK
ncbi:MAG: hypothetical protein H6Q93_1502 [Nitrospirae bacterium]|jgi:hypothetical protein|nr:hypothetical protein [Nitrospirota bacterium]MBS1127513.1 hypothetical protein [Nitrospirota bacterium]